MVALKTEQWYMLKQHKPRQRHRFTKIQVVFSKLTSTVEQRQGYPGTRKSNMQT